MNKTYQFEGLLQNDGWMMPAYVTTDADGAIVSMSDQQPENTDIEKVAGYALPGFQNAHSHSFQFAMAGLAETHKAGATDDDFWSWREKMYQIALTMNPDQFEDIARMLYTEMLRHGYTHVAEFHYVHHDQTGKPYDNVAELGSRLISAAKEVGLGITLVPIFYQKGGFGMDPVERQRRFINATTEEYLRLLEMSQKASSEYHKANVGLGIHSLRAVESQSIIDALKACPEEYPVHIHVSEQLKEIEDSIKFLGKRPVEWCLDNMGLNERFHMVHATHLTEDETTQLAKSGANVVICPSTEGNLGDGLFPFAKYWENGGNWSIGTDSHVGLNPLEELRILDYGQRLITHKRNTYVNAQSGDGATNAFDMALKAGRKAMGNFNAEYFKVGTPFDVVVYDADCPFLSCTSSDYLLPTIIFSLDASHTLGTITDGKWRIKEGKLTIDSPVQQQFKSTIKALNIR